MVASTDYTDIFLIIKKNKVINTVIKQLTISLIQLLLFLEGNKIKTFNKGFPQGVNMVGQISGVLYNCSARDIA